MSKLFDAIDDTLKAFIEAQPVFYVATAPSGPEGHVNLSPKGGKGLFRVTGPRGFSYVDLIGSGIETVSHLRENGRIVAMFCSFSGPPKIVRLHGSGRVVQQGDTGFDERVAAFDVADEQRPAVRSVIEIDVTRVSDSCGFVVPRMAYEGERDQLYRWTDNRLRKQGPDALRSYAAAHNAESIDGLAGLDPPAAGPARETARRPEGSVR
jgi:pyridoxamine 5'-phosphate oxidase-like protein